MRQRTGNGARTLAGQTGRGTWSKMFQPKKIQTLCAGVSGDRDCLGLTPPLIGHGSEPLSHQAHDSFSAPKRTRRPKRVGAQCAVRQSKGAGSAGRKIPDPVIGKRLKKNALASRFLQTLRDKYPRSRNQSPG